MTIEEIRERIESLNYYRPEDTRALIGTVVWVVDLLEAQQIAIAELEKKLKTAESAAAHANNIASCLANGIQPD